MATRSARVGVHGRNDYWQCKFEKRDYELIERAGIEHVKMIISDQAAVNPQVLRNAVEVCKRLREIKRDMDFVVRLFDAGVRFDPEKKKGVYPTPQEFADRFAPMMNRLYEECPYVVKFEVLNEPNHIGGLGGWGPEADQARDFSRWFLETYDLLKDTCPWGASLGFPGLVPHHGLKPEAPQLNADLDWIEICRDAVERADWLGVHCYWQNPSYTEGHHLHPDWGLHFEAYHGLFPDKIIEITEFGNSNGQTPGLPIDRERIAQEYVEYYQELFKHPYINSAAAFIMSSGEGPWGEQGFTWRKESGEFFPVVERVGAMPRPDLVRAVAVPPVVAVAVPPVEERYFPETQRTVKGAFLQAFNRYGLEVCGYPITEQFEEAGVPSQYFQHVAMEEYEPGKIRLKAVSDEVLRARQMVAQWQREAQRLRQQETASQATIAQLQQKVQELRQQAAASQETITQWRREVDRLRQQEMTSRATIAQLQQKVQELHQQTAASQETITQLRREVNRLRQQLAEATTTIPVPPPTIAPPPIEDITDRLPRHPEKRFDRRTLDQIQYLVIQHSVLPGDFPPEKIATYLVEKRLWPGIGYHFYITSDGKIYQTNPLETVCYFAGANLQYNPLGVCICFAGNFTTEIPTAAQLSSGGKLLAFLMQELHLPLESIKGHKKFVATQSPGQQWDSGRKWKDMLLTKVREAQS
jgi:hypothetical protein